MPKPVRRDIALAAFFALASTLYWSEASARGGIQFCTDESCDCGWVYCTTQCSTPQACADHCGEACLPVGVACTNHAVCPLPWHVDICDC